MRTFSLFIAGLASAFLLVTCKNLKKQRNTEEKTAFYTLKAERDTVKNISYFKVSNVQIVNSVLNKRETEEQAKNPSYLEVKVTDKQKNTVIVYTSHPLFKRFDLYEESGEISSKSISLQQGEVTFRIPYFAEFKKIEITETINFKKANQVIIKNEK